MDMDAHDMYSELWRWVVVSGQMTQVTEGMRACSSDSQIINLVRQLVADSGLLELKCLKDDTKDEAKAIACRKAGNESFHPKVKRYVKAIEHYNESIALSEAGSESLAIAYANRSAVCFELKEYRECLENIRLARENPYPEHLLPKLAKREEECLKLFNIGKSGGDQENEQREPKLSYKTNPKIPHISSCIELKEDENFGRYLVTNRNLNAGDIIIAEEPFSTLLLPGLRYTHCDYCHDDNFLALIPCNGCTVTMFCSESCRQKAFDSYHRIECPVIKIMQNLFTKVILMSMRTVTTAIGTFGYDLAELLRYTELIDEGSLNPFMLDWSCIEPKQVYSTIHALATNQKLRSPSDLVQRGVFAIIMSDLLFEKTDLGNLCRSDESRDLIRRLIFRHSQTSPVNMHSLMYMNYKPEDEEKFQQEHSGCGSFPILSMINHSCAPNLVRMSLANGRVIVLVNRPIKKGGQLFDNYGFHHCLETLQERQSGLRSQYCFKCQCEACVRNYPKYSDLPHVQLRPGMKHPIDYDELDRLREHDMKTALRMMPQYCQFLNAFDAQYPNFEVSSVQEALLRCCQIVFARQSRKIKYRNLCAL